MNILDELTADHRRLRKLLTLFERELDDYEDSGDASLQLMLDIAHYYSDYFNRFHHPLEDCLLERLSQAHSQADFGAGHAMAEHGQLIDVTHDLLMALDEALHGAILPRAELVDAGRRFVDINLHHMNQEELGPFVQASIQLKDADWLALASRVAVLQDRTDPGHSRRQYEEIVAGLAHTTGDAEDTGVSA